MAEISYRLIFRFYEWEKRSDKSKQPFLIYQPESREWFQSRDPSTTPNLVKIAALFDVWQPPEVRSSVGSPFVDLSVSCLLVDFFSAGFSGIQLQYYHDTRGSLIAVGT